MDGLIAGVAAELQRRAPDVRIDQGYGHAETPVARLEADSPDVTALPASVVLMLRHRRVLAALPMRIDHPSRDLGLLVRATPQRPAMRRLHPFEQSEVSGLSRAIPRHEQDALWRS